MKRLSAEQSKYIDDYVSESKESLPAYAFEKDMILLKTWFMRCPRRPISRR